MASLKRKRIDPEDNDYSAIDGDKMRDLFSKASDTTKGDILWDYMQSRNFNVSHQTKTETGVCYQTLLSEVVRNNKPELFSYLLQHGADVNYWYGSP